MLGLDPGGRLRLVCFRGGLLLLIGVAALLRLRGEAPDKPDQIALGQFVLLKVALTAPALHAPPAAAESSAVARLP
jgi:hypothetical protein